MAVVYNYSLEMDWVVVVVEFFGLLACTETGTGGWGSILSTSPSPHKTPACTHKRMRLQYPTICHFWPSQSISCFLPSLYVYFKTFLMTCAFPKFGQASGNFLGRKRTGGKGEREGGRLLAQLLLPKTPSCYRHR